jgi:hypothetical protein
MSMKMNISMGGRGWGSLTLDDGREALERQGIRRTAYGFLLPIPATMRLAMDDSATQPVVTDLQVIFYIEDGKSTEFGVAHDRSLYKGMIGGHEPPTSLQMRGQLSALAMVEKWRGDRPPTFRVECSARGHLLYGTDPKAKISSEPFEMSSGSGSVTYPQDAWVALLRRVGVVGNILVETPLPHDPPTGWEETWKGLAEAYENFMRGGGTGWKGTVASGRLALEKWRGIEEPSLGPGWQAPTMQQRMQWTKRQRLDLLRWALHNYAHHSVHSAADETTREEANLVLVTLAGLFAVRDP